MQNSPLVERGVLFMRLNIFFSEKGVPNCFAQNFKHSGFFGFIFFACKVKGFYFDVFNILCGKGVITQNNKIRNFSGG